MLLIWSRILEPTPKKMIAEELRIAEMTYDKALIEVIAAGKNDYELGFIKETQLIFLKYKPEENVFYTLIVNGTKQEINSLQEDRMK